MPHIKLRVSLQSGHPDLLYSQEWVNVIFLHLWPQKLYRAFRFGTLWPISCSYPRHSQLTRHSLMLANGRIRQSLTALVFNYSSYIYGSYSTSAFVYFEEYVTVSVRYCVHASNATASCCGLSINHSWQDSCKINDFIVYSIFHEICTRLSCALSYRSYIIGSVYHLSILFKLALQALVQLYDFRNAREITLTGPWKTVGSTTLLFWIDDC